MEPKIEDLDIRSRLFIIRGVPGSGKSTLAQILAMFFDRASDGKAEHFTTDEFWVDDEGNYNFDPNRLDDAHQWCRRQVEASLSEGVHSAIVHNTFAQRWEVTPFFDLAEKYGYEPFLIETQNLFGSDHPIPERTFDRIADNFQNVLEVHRPDVR